MRHGRLSFNGFVVLQTDLVLVKLSSTASPSGWSEFALDSLPLAARAGWIFGTINVT